LSEYYAFLSECFALDSVIIYKNEENKQEFFSAEDANEHLNRLTREYFIKEKGQGS